MAKRFWTAAAGMLVAMATAGSALADSPYLRSNMYDASGLDRVTVEAGHALGPLERLRPER